MVNYKITFKNRGIETSKEFSGNNLLDILGQFYEFNGNCWIIKIETTDNY
jgi:hypothetical protein